MDAYSNPTYGVVNYKVWSRYGCTLFVKYIYVIVISSNYLCLAVGAPRDQQEREEEDMQADGLQEVIGRRVYARRSK